MEKGQLIRISRLERCHNRTQDNYVKKFFNGKRKKKRCYAIKKVKTKTMTNKTQRYSEQFSDQVTNWETQIMTSRVSAWQSERVTLRAFVILAMNIIEGWCFHQMHSKRASCCCVDHLPSIETSPAFWIGIVKILKVWNIVNRTLWRGIFLSLVGISWEFESILRRLNSDS